MDDIMKELQAKMDGLKKEAETERARKGEAIRQLQSAMEMLKALGWTPAFGYASWTHLSMKECPACHGIAIIQKYQFDNGGWIAICSDCSHRTEAQLTPNRAVKAWNAGEYTYLSKLTQNRLDGSPRERRKRHDEDDT